MLLLMIEAQFQEVRTTLDDERHRLDDGLVDMRSILPHIRERRARKHSSSISSMKCTFGLIIAVEQIDPALVERPVARDVIAKNECLEEPAAMGEVPFGGRCVGHRLHCRVRIGERCHEIQAQRPNARVTGARLVETHPAGRMVGAGNAHCATFSWFEPNRNGAFARRRCAAPTSRHARPAVRLQRDARPTGIFVRETCLLPERPS